MTTPSRCRPTSQHAFRGPAIDVSLDPTADIFGVRLGRMVLSGGQPRRLRRPQKHGERGAVTVVQDPSSADGELVPQAAQQERVCSSAAWPTRLTQCPSWRSRSSALPSRTLRRRSPPSMPADRDGALTRKPQHRSQHAQRRLGHRGHHWAIAKRLSKPARSNRFVPTGRAPDALGPARPGDFCAAPSSSRARRRERPRGAEPDLQVSTRPGRS